jgi:DNA-binding NtrC family response regulator
LFLDEIDSLSIAVQAKLLRLLEEGSYRPLGAERFSRANVRVIAATNQDLECRIREKQFRPDLYFRLRVLHVHLPALRERRRDIRLLASHFLERCCDLEGTKRKSFSVSCLGIFENYDWPGNVRELLNVVQAAVTLCPGPIILPCHISLAGSPSRSEDTVMPFREARRHAVEAFERQYVTEMLAKHDGNISRAALSARKDRWTFGRLAKKYGV